MASSNGTNCFVAALPTKPLHKIATNQIRRGGMGLGLTAPATLLASADNRMRRRFPFIALRGLSAICFQGPLPAPERTSLRGDPTAGLTDYRLSFYHQFCGWIATQH